jgi:hypothetical protein
MSFIFDGHSTIIAFLSFPAINFKEKTMTPPGYDGGGPNDTTNMRNLVVRTKQPKKLITLDTTTANVFYDADQLLAILGMINVLQVIRVTFPDGNNITFYGWLDKFKHGEHKEGEPAIATCTIEPSNQTVMGVENVPVFAKGAVPPP